MLNRLSFRTRLVSVAAAGAAVVLGIALPLLYRDLGGRLSDVISEELTVRMRDLDTRLQNAPTPPSTRAGRAGNAGGLA